MGIFSNIFDRQQSSSPITPVTDFPSNDGGETAPSPVVSADNEQQEQTPPPSPSVPNPQNGTQGVSFTQQPTADVTQVTPGQGIQIDWSKPYSQIEQNPILRQMTPYDIAKDYGKNGDGNWSTLMPWLSKYGDHDKTVEANDILAKKAERQAKWEQLGNLFSHIGNFVGTAIGAPSQQVESAKELTERQRKIRESTDALRQKGYDQMMVNIFKERQDKQAQMQAEAAAKAKEAQAAYYGAQENQVNAMTPVKVDEAKASTNQHNSVAAYNEEKKKTEVELRGKKGQLLDKQADAASASAADKRSHIGVNQSTIGKNNAEAVKAQKSTPRYSADEYRRKFTQFFNAEKKKGGGLAAVYEKKYKIGGRKGKQWDANLMQTFVNDIEDRGLAPKSSGLGIGGRNKGKHLSI